MKRESALLHIAETISVSLPGGFFAWILMILMNPIFRHESVTLLIIKTLKT